MVLGQKRATSVFDYYKTLGVDSSRLSTVSYGEELPLDPRENEEAWAKNRRAHSAVQK
jgi:peptidoglycan-associated lipoprotein